MIYETPGARTGDWDSFHIRRLAVAEWPRQVRHAFEGHAKHKRSGEEARYLHALLADEWLRGEMLRLGSVGVPEA